VGRFISEDPLGFSADFNKYQYALSNPIYFRDPSGTSVISSSTPSPGQSTDSGPNLIGRKTTADAGTGFSSDGSNSSSSSAETNSNQECSGRAFGFLGFEKILFKEVGFEVIGLGGYDSAKGPYYGGIAGVILGPVSIGVESVRYTRDWSEETTAIGIGGGDGAATPPGSKVGKVGFGGFASYDGSKGWWASAGDAGGGAYGSWAPGGGCK
jgi:hypothetical protein